MPRARLAAVFLLAGAAALFALAVVPLPYVLAPATRFPHAVLFELRSR
jgi:hypothetical protein